MSVLPYGLFIAVEGVDGSGKSSLIPALAEYLRTVKDNVHVTREPGGTSFSEAIRNLLKNDVCKFVEQTALAMLVNAARRDHVITKLMPALKEGGIVLTDRYVCSTFMYQYAAVDLEAICELGTAGLTPDLTIMLDVSFDNYTKRIFPRIEDSQITTEELNHLDIMDERLFERRRSQMLEYYNRYSNRCILIDTNNKTQEAVLSVAIDEICAYLKSKS